MGIMTTFLPMSIDGNMRADEIKRIALESLKSYNAKNEAEEFLISRVHRYEPHPDEWEETMASLFADGQAKGMPEEYR